MNANSSTGPSSSSATKIRDIFAANPEEFESPITSGGESIFFSTPAMLGINNKNDSRYISCF